MELRRSTELIEHDRIFIKHTSNKESESLTDSTGGNGFAVTIKKLYYSMVIGIQRRTLWLSIVKVPLSLRWLDVNMKSYVWVVNNLIVNVLN